MMMDFFSKAKGSISESFNKLSDKIDEKLEASGKRVGDRFVESLPVEDRANGRKAADEVLFGKQWNTQARVPVGTTKAELFGLSSMSDTFNMVKKAEDAPAPSRMKF